MKSKKKAILFSILAYIVSLLPVVVWVIINRENYFVEKTSYASAGIFIGCLLLLVALKDRLGDMLKNGAQLKLSLVMLFVFWAVKDIADTVIVLCLFSAGGSLLALIPEYYAKKNRRLANMTEQAEINSDVMKKVWNGRV